MSRNYELFPDDDNGNVLWQMIEDGKKLATLTTEFKSEFEKLVSESMPNNK